MLISIIIPVYNEINTLPTVVENTIKTPYDKEIIIVDDGSTDGTREWLLSVDKINKSNGYRTTIKTLFHNKNVGKGGAIRTALQSVEGDIIIIQDADLEYNPKDYPILLTPIIENKTDIVYGSRFSAHSYNKTPFWHYLANRTVTFLLNLLNDLNLTDMETGYKAFKKDTLKNIKIDSNDFRFEPEITIKIAKNGYKIYEVPISYQKRKHNEGKKLKWKDGLLAIIAILKYSRK